MTEIQTRLVRLDHLHPNPDNPRREAGDVSELAASIRSQGIKQNIIVRPAPELSTEDDEHFIIEDGYRRWVAASQVITMARVDIDTPHPHESLAVREIVTSLTTTLHRADLNAIEKAHAYRRLRDEAGMDQRQIARLVGLKDPGSVSRYLSLLELSPSYQRAVANGKVTVTRALEAVTHARATQRRKSGQKQRDVGWEPDHFTDKHSLARRAKSLCDAREHTSRRRLGGIACGQCWETAIRNDQMNVDSVRYREAGFEVPFIPPFMASGNDNHKE